MSREGKTSAPKPEKDKSAAEFYRLHSQAIRDLVTASEENSPQVSQEELRKYQSGGGFKVADWVKLLLIKWWFPGAACYFFFWGLGVYFTSTLDIIVISAVALGFVTDLLTNNVLRFVAPVKGANDRWMMYPRKGFASLPLNVLHSCVIMFLVYSVYNMINLALVHLKGLEENAVSVGVEPVLFGLLWLGFDMLLIAAKFMLKRIISDAKKSAAGAR